MDKIVKEKKAVKHFKTGTSISLGAFLAMTASMVLTVYEYPTFAESGWSCILFLIVCGLCYFLPVAIAAAEMGTVRKWSKDGAYVWVKNTLGRRWGWYALFSQWCGISIAFLGMLYFVISGLGFIFGGTTGFNVLTEQVGNANLAGNSVVALAQPVYVTSANWAPALVNASSLSASVQSALSHQYGNYSQYIQIAAATNNPASFVPFANSNTVIAFNPDQLGTLGWTVSKGMWTLPNGIVVPANKVTGTDLISAYIYQNGSFSNIEFSNLQLNGVQANGQVIGNLIGDNSGSLVNLYNTPLWQGHAENVAMAESGSIFGVACLILIVWTCLSMFGVKWIAENARMGFWGGIAAPTLILVIMGFIYIGRDLGQGGEAGQIIKNIPWENLTGGSGPHPYMFTRGFAGEEAMITFTAIVVAFAGPEGSGNVAYSLKKVERNYPIAVITLMFMSISFSICGGMFIALGTTGAINGTGGISVTFMKFFMISDPGMSVPMAETATRIIMCFICWGILAQVFAWIVGPSSGLAFAASQKIIPDVFAKRNKFGIAWVVLFFQLGLVILWELIITIVLGGVAGTPGSFDAGLQASMLVYLIIYFLMFVGDIQLWLKAPHLPRAFSVKSKGFGIGLSVVGFLMMCIGWGASWIDQIGADQIWFPTIVCILLFAWLLGIISYEATRAWNLKKLCEKYGFNIHDYPEEVKYLARKLFMLKLTEENVPEINEYFKDPELKDATPEEIEAEKKLRAEEKASKGKKVAVAA